MRSRSAASCQVTLQWKHRVESGRNDIRSGKKGHIVNTSSTAASSRSGTQSLQRAAALLRELTGANRAGLLTAELAARVGLDRTTVHRMLRCLVDEGLASQEPVGKRYFLGPLAYEMGLAAAERTDLRALCQPTLAQLARETGDTAFLMVRSGDDAVCLDRAEGSYPVKTFVVDVGTRRPLGLGAGSLAILSALAADEAEAVLARNAQRVEHFDGMTVAQLRRMMVQARQSGHVAMEVIDVPGVRAIAVPLLTSSGRVAAGLSVAAVERRMGPEREAALLARLRELAAELRQVLPGTAWQPAK